MNETLKVGTIFHCDKLYDDGVMDKYNIYWTQTVTGCKIVQFLQDMYKFNISYTIQPLETNIFGQSIPVYPHQGDGIDIYTRPMSLREELLDYGYPIQALNKWRFGFLLRRPLTVSVFKSFYNKPFSQTLWLCLHAMGSLVILIFYILKIWETRVVGRVREQGFTYEMLMVFGAFFQHIPPLHAKLLSRRTAYFVFFLFTYVIYSFYTSNLLSHLVNDKEKEMDFDDLVDNNYECAIMNDFNLTKGYNPNDVIFNVNNITPITKKNLNIKIVPLTEGLEGVKNRKIALLSDYMGLKPYLKRHFKRDVICKLTQIDLILDIKKYFFTSKNFKYKDLFKIGTLRALETGVLKRITQDDSESPLDCEGTRLEQTQILQISRLLSVLLGFYILAVLILIGERIHYSRNIILWPYLN